MVNRSYSERQRGFCDRQTDGQTDICNCRVAFATENSIFITKTLQGLSIEEKQQYFETFVISHLMSMSSIVTNLLMYGLHNKNFRNGLSSIRRRHNPGTEETAV